VEDDPEKLSYAVALCTPMALSFADLLVIVVLEDLIIVNDRRYYLIEYLSQIFVAFLGY
jgi:hypothetical protein